MAEKPKCDFCDSQKIVRRYKSRFHIGFLCLFHRFEQTQKDKEEKARLKREAKHKKYLKRRDVKARQRQASREYARKKRVERAEQLRAEIYAQRHVTEEALRAYYENKKEEAKLLKKLRKKTVPPEVKQQRIQKHWLKQGYDPEKVLHCSNFKNHVCNSVDTQAWRQGLWDPREVRVRGNYLIQACSWFDIRAYGSERLQQAACKEALENKLLKNGVHYGALESEI